MDVTLSNLSSDSIRTSFLCPECTDGSLVVKLFDTGGNLITYSGPSINSIGGLESTFLINAGENYTRVINLQRFFGVHEHGLYGAVFMNYIPVGSYVIQISLPGYPIKKIEFKIIEPIGRDKDEYDAIGLSTFIEVPKEYHTEYFKDVDMINPWGGIESMLTHSIAEEFKIPCAHSPMMVSREIMDMEVGIVDPRKAPETSSVSYLHCILKGLHKSPKIVSYAKGLNAEDISCLIIPDGCVGLPTLAAIEHGIPVIAVKENKNYMRNNLEDLPFQKGKLFIVENYLEAVGIMHTIKAGVDQETIRRPISRTTIIQNKENIETSPSVINSTIRGE